MDHHSFMHLNLLSFKSTPKRVIMSLSSLNLCLLASDAHTFKFHKAEWLVGYTVIPGSYL